MNKDPDIIEKKVGNTTVPWNKKLGGPVYVEPEPASNAKAVKGKPKTKEPVVETETPKADEK